MKATFIKYIALLLAILLIPLCIGCEPQTSDPQDTESTVDGTTSDATEETTADATEETTEAETEEIYYYEFKKPEGAYKVEYYLIDEKCDHELVREEYFTADTFKVYLKLANYSVYDIKITKM